MAFGIVRAGALSLVSCSVSRRPPSGGQAKLRATAKQQSSRSQERALRSCLPTALSTTKCCRHENLPGGHLLRDSTRPEWRTAEDWILGLCESPFDDWMS